jgi:hypothetical protein
MFHPFVAGTVAISAFRSRCCHDEQEATMLTSNKPRNHLQNFMPPHLSAWWSGFEYVFGYQMKMVKEFWGIADSEDRHR